MDTRRCAGLRGAAFWAVAALGAAVDVCALWPSLDDKARLVELAFVAQYAVLAGTSVFSAQWLFLLLLNALAGAAYAFAVRSESERLLEMRAAVVGINRRIGHAEALFSWVILSIAFPWPLVPWTLRTAMLAGLVLYGPRWMDRLTRESRRRGWLRAGLGDEVADAWLHHVQRRLWFAAATVVGFAILGLLAPSQFLVILPLLGAFAAGVGLRLIELVGDPRRALTAARREVLRRALRSAEGLDVGFFLALVMAIAAGLWWEVHPGSVASTQDRASRTLPEHVVGAGAVQPPRDPPIRLFVISDSQLHELSGKRSGVHLDLVDGVVPVAVRPVELDLLSIFTVVRLERARRALELRAGGALPWVHLGDFGDLGCRSELERFARLDPGAWRPLAVAAGNHDSTFCGNFAWHPSWDAACGAKPRATKEWADGVLAKRSPSSAPMTDWFAPFMPAVVPLGPAAGHDIVGVFVDTSDFTMPSLGVAGVQGEVSLAQADWIAQQLAGRPDARIVLFMHHPIAELSRVSRWRMGRLADALHERVVGVVSAHTHLAALRWSELGSRHVPEIVVGSTIDPPQEAAVLEIGENAAGRVAMRLVTIPAVARKGATCEDAPVGVDPAACERLWQEVQAKCPAVANERPVRVHPRTPGAVKREQQERANALLECLPRLGLPSFSRSTTPLDDDDVAGQIDQAAERLLEAPGASAIDELDRLSCLSWAGSVLQKHKLDAQEDWTYARALQLSTSEQAAEAATELVADESGGIQRECHRGGTAPVGAAR